MPVPLVPDRACEPLIQLRFRRRPWRLLVACILLNRTRGSQVRPMLDPLFARWPNARAMAEADPEELRRFIGSLGLGVQRTNALMDMSACFPGRRMTREEVLALPGCGSYAADAYQMLVCGDLTVEPDDPELRRWLEWAQHPWNVPSWADAPRGRIPRRRTQATRWSLTIASSAGAGVTLEYDAAAVATIASNLDVRDGRRRDVERSDGGAWNRTRVRAGSACGLPARRDHFAPGYHHST